MACIAGAIIGGDWFIKLLEIHNGGNLWVYVKERTLQLAQAQSFRAQRRMTIIHLLLQKEIRRFNDKITLIVLS